MGETTDYLGDASSLHSCHIFSNRYIKILSQALNFYKSDYSVICSRDVRLSGATQIAHNSSIRILRLPHATNDAAASMSNLVLDNPHSNVAIGAPLSCLCGITRVYMIH